MNGDSSGSMEVSSFWDFIYLKTYPGDEDAVCSGIENPEANT
jgi:hypothetical protein